MKRSTSMLVTAMGLTLALAQTSINAAEMVHGYVTDSDGNPVSDGSGDCVRTNYKESNKYLKECGYKLVVDKAAVVESTPVGSSVTIAESAKILKGDKVIAESGVVVEEIIISNVQFAFNSDQLTDEYKAKLDTASDRLKPHRKLLRSGLAVLNVVGHTDSVGNDDYNQKLSERRAQTVADYLIKQDLSRAAFTRVIGRGESEPLASNDTQAGRDINRRVVLQVIGK